MSADYRTEHFKGYAHKDSIHVVVSGENEWPLGDFSLEEIAELVQLAGLAWPSYPGVQVRYVIEARTRGLEHGKGWAVMWSAPADDEDGTAGVSEEFARVTFEGMAAARMLEWRLARRTVVTADEVLVPDAEAEARWSAIEGADD